MPKGFLSWVFSRLLLQRSQSSSVPQRDGIYLFALYLHRMHSYLTTMGAFTTPFVKGFCLPPCEQDTPSFREAQLHRTECNSTLPSLKWLEHWEHMPCPAQSLSSTLFFRHRERGEEDAGKKKICIPVHHSSLTNILSGWSLLYRIFTVWGRRCPSEARCFSRILSLKLNAK